MADTPGPWDQPTAGPGPAPQPRLGPRRSPRLIALMMVLALGGLGVWGLSRLFPGRLSLSDDWNDLAWGGGMLALVTANLLARRIALKEVARNVLIWSALAGVLVVGYTYRDDLANVGAKIRSALVPAYAVSTSAHEMVLTRDADGAYYAVGKVNGQPITFLVDTGASDIVLSPADARRLGVDLGSLHFDDPYETANGVGHGARFTASELEVGAIKLSNVKASINQAPMKTSLLGMAFFKRLDSFAFEGEQLHLKWHDAR